MINSRNIFIKRAKPPYKIYVYLLEKECSYFSTDFTLNLT